MRIAYVYDLIYPYSKGGVERRVAELARRLVLRGHDVTVYGTKMWDGSATRSMDGVLVHGINVGAPISTQSGRRSIRQGFVFSIRCVALIGRREYDIVDVQSMAPLACLAVLALCRIRRMACVITWHEVWMNYWREYLGWLGQIGRAAEWLIARIGLFHAAVSIRTAKRLARIGLRDVDVVPNGVDPTVFRPQPANGVKGGITYVGRLAPHKNLFLLTEAVRLLAKRDLEPSVTFVGDGPLRTDLVRDASELQNVEIVSDLDAESDLADHLASSRVFALTSTREGFGMAALEALSCGVPVVTVESPDNAAADLVQEGRNGLLCAAEPEALASALERVLTDDDLHARLSQGALRSAREYEWGSSVVIAERFYRKVLTRSTNRRSRWSKARRSPA